MGELPIPDEMFASYTVNRASAAGTFSRGIYQAPATTEVTINASIQPLKGDELQQIPGGQRVKAGYSVFSREEIRTENEETKVPADVIEYGSEELVVVAAAYWAEPTEHWEGVAARKDAIIGS